MKMLKSSALMSLMLLLGLLFMYSCGKKELAPVDIPAVAAEVDIFSKIKVKDGILAFEDQNHYQAVLNTMVQNPEQVRTELAKKTDFVSLQNLLNEDLVRFSQGESTVLNADKYFTTLPDDDLKIIDFAFYSISNLMNKDAALYINDRLIQYTSDFVYTLHSGDPADLGKTSRILEAGRYGEIYATKVETTVSGDQRNVIRHTCKTTNAAGTFQVRNALNVHAFATQESDGTFINQLTAELRVRKLRAATAPDGKSEWNPYPCGGANIDAGNIKLLWESIFIDEPYTDQTQTNHASIHTFLILSRTENPNINVFDDITLFPNSHGLTGEFAPGNCAVDLEQVTEYIGCSVTY